MALLEENQSETIKYYSGNIDSRIRLDILKELKSDLIPFSSDFRVNKNIFQVVDETLENVLNYSFESQNKANFLELDLRKLNTYTFSYKVRNITLKSDREIIESKMNEIFSLSQDDIKSKIFSSLQSPILPERNNAGLGLLMIAKKHFGNIAFSFKDHSNDSYYLDILVTIKSK